MNWEYTNATTTQLVNINNDSWDEDLLNWSGAPREWFGTPTHPGNVIGHWICPQDNPIRWSPSLATASAVIALAAGQQKRRLPLPAPGADGL